MARQTIVRTAARSATDVEARPAARDRKGATMDEKCAVVRSVPGGRGIARGGVNLATSAQKELVDRLFASDSPLA